MGYVVITWWPDEETVAMVQVLQAEASLPAATAQSYVDDVLNGGFIYLELPSVAHAKVVATAAAQLGALAEFGPVRR